MPKSEPLSKEYVDFWLELTNLDTDQFTANSVAHLVAQDGRCTLESRQQASNMLERLVHEGLAETCDPTVIGGDYLPTFTVSGNDLGHVIFTQGTY